MASELTTDVAAAAPASAPATAAAKDWLWRPALIVFISNACIMIIELVAGRMVAPFIGSSLYTWTTIIGVILAGISIGNYIGGRLADRFASRRMLGALFMLAGFGALSVLITVSAFGEAGLPRLPGVGLLPRMVLYISVIYVLPSILLGMISPLVIKLTLSDLSKTGNVIGRIYAASALGSILGTFLTGYFLVSYFGTRTIMLGTGLLLIGLGVLLGQWFKRPAVAVAAAAAVVLGLLAARPAYAEYLRSVCTKETDYFCIRVRTEEREGEPVQVLTLDRLVHSYTSLDNPKKLIYQYEKVGAEVLDFLSERDRNLDVFFIGGGGYTLPKYIEFLYPDAAVEVAEIDPGVTDIAYERLGLSRSTAIKSFNEDARQYLAELRGEKKYNFVLGDAFNDFSVPYHLTTSEFNRLVRKHMTDDGVYMLNLIDGNDLPFVGAFIRTLGETFEHVYLINSSPQLFGTTRNTFVVLASPAPIDLARLRTYAGDDAAQHVDTWLATDEEVQSVLAKGPLRLSDEFVPTDRLLAPMFEESDAAR